ncbi:sigma-54 dependent transcriptional regulator [Idiomarina seosinensis]|uniref:sigma-54-dependent transcriptional regulator n=1 Tax=Idiomarina seosinensis TaxID=281739 RepID=UPI00384BEE1F
MAKAKVLIVEDDANLREAIIDTLELSDYQCVQAESGEKALLTLKNSKIDLIISDVQMPGIDGLQLLRSLKNQGYSIPVIMMTAFAKVDDAVIAIKEGAVDYLSKPFSTEALLQLVQRHLPPQTETEASVIAEDPSSLALLEMANKVAATDATVMITGSSGTGKEVLARYIHEQSSRNKAPFVAINCAAIPENMLESILFGYEKGAFTGATQASPGKFELAQGGTLLLDEVTEMDINLQAKLLRVLQERQVERLGARKGISLDIRVIATSNRDLQQAVKDGTFREDLLYRLNVFPLRWRALKERPGDIVPIANALLNRHKTRLGVKTEVSFGENAKQVMQNYSWPGNIRELENVIQRALVLRNGTEIAPKDLMLEVVVPDAVLPEQVETPSAMPARTEEPDALGDSLFHQEYCIIKKALQRHKGKRKPVAEELGISARTLRYKLAKIRDQGLSI